MDRGFLEAFDHAAVAGVAGDDVVDVDVAKGGAALGERFDGRFGVPERKNDGVANIMKAEVRGDDVLDDAAAAAGAFDAEISGDRASPCLPSFQVPEELRSWISSTPARPVGACPYETGA